MKTAVGKLTTMMLSELVIQWHQQANQPQQRCLELPSQMAFHFIPEMEDTASLAELNVWCQSESHQQIRKDIFKPHFTQVVKLSLHVYDLT